MTDDELRDAIQDLPLLSCPPEVTGRILAARRRPAVRWWAWAMPLAAAAALAGVLFASRPTPTPRYTAAELAAARTQTIESVSTVMTLIQRTQREAVSEVLGRQVPGTLRASVRKALQLSEGGQG